MREKRALLLWLVLFLSPSRLRSQEIYYNELPVDIVEARLKRAEPKNDAREQALKQLFDEADCRGEHFIEQPVKGSRLPNVICELPGAGEFVVVVGAHFDKVNEGEGVVDNWSGASLLPTLYQSLRAKPRQLTFRFIGFTDEEKGMFGSNFYVRQLTAEERVKIVAMVNIDSLGLSSTKVWVTRSDKKLMASLLQVSNALNVPVAGVNVEQVGDSDSHAFASKKIPVIDFHSLTQNTLPILHSRNDNLAAVQWKEYYDSYRLLAAYLAFLDETLPAADTPTQK